MCSTFCHTGTLVSCLQNSNLHRFIDPPATMHSHQIFDEDRCQNVSSVWPDIRDDQTELTFESGRSRRKASKARSSCRIPSHNFGQDYRDTHFEAKSCHLVERANWMISPTTALSPLRWDDPPPFKSGRKVVGRLFTRTTKSCLLTHRTLNSDRRCRFFFSQIT